MRLSLSGAALAAMSVLVAAPALAQTLKPLPILVVDMRGAVAKLGTDATTAADLNVDKTLLPGTGLAFTAGVHLYPLRWHGFAIGVGGEAVVARAMTKGGTDATGLVTPDLNRRFQGMAAIVSVNFGGRDGWSYISGGAGPLRFENTSSIIDHATPPARTTQNVGGGARWFTNQHVAATFDVRAYLTRPSNTELTVAGRLRHRVLVFSVGISIR